MHSTDLQLTYIDILTKEKGVKEKGENYLWNNIDWLSLSELSDKEAKNIYRDFIDQQITLTEYTKWLSTQPKIDLGLGIATEAVKEVKEEKKVEEKKEEKKVFNLLNNLTNFFYLKLYKLIQKEAYDIELTSFDAAKKIALIKEIRGITNLGLKEAKELVEKAPTIISKNIKTNEAEAIMKKLTESGAKITLK